MSIVWIDDDIEIIDPVVQPIVEAGHEITRIRRADQALDSVEALQSADLILLDMILPVGDHEEDFGRYPGVTLLRKLREEHGVKTPVIVFSVVEEEKLEEELKSLDVADYVLKPALPSELKAAVDKVIGFRASPGTET